MPPERAKPLTKLAIAIEILLAYAVTRVRMRRGDVRAVVAAHRAESSHGRHTRGLDEKQTWRVARRLGTAVDRTLRPLPTDSRCLAQALVLLRLLSARGIPATFVIGARSRPEFEAHAWLEYAGSPVLPELGFDESRLLEL
jgi:Transglutaminase-like superfamily